MMATLAVALVLAIVAIWRARIDLKAKGKRFEKNKEVAWISLQTGSCDLPSWMTNEKMTSEFLFAVQRLALRKGVPHRRILYALTTEHIFVRLIRFAGALEVRQVSFSEQHLAVAETIFRQYAHDERMRAETEVFFSN